MKERDNGKKKMRRTKITLKERSSGKIGRGNNTTERKSEAKSVSNRSKEEKQSTTEITEKNEEELH